MRLYDKFELLAGYGTFPVVVLGNLVSREFELIDLETVPLPPETQADFTARGLGFVGTFALLDGQGRCEFAVTPDADMSEALATAYARLVLEKEHSISTSWLKHLWSLVDPREIN